MIEIRWKSTATKSFQRISYLNFTPPYKVNILNIWKGGSRERVWKLVRIVTPFLPQGKETFILYSGPTRWCAPGKMWPKALDFRVHPITPSCQKQMAPILPNVSSWHWDNCKQTSVYLARYVRSNQGWISTKCRYKCNLKTNRRIEVQWWEICLVSGVWCLASGVGWKAIFWWYIFCCSV